MKQWLLILTLGSVFFSCNKEEETIVFVADEIVTYFDNFEIEAQNRQLSYDLNALKINAELTDIGLPNVIGQSIRSNNSITIRVDRSYWNGASDYNRELLIFHELGHAVLLRGHKDSSDRLNRCISIMRSASSVCNCIYNKTTREAYLNELFNE